MPNPNLPDLSAFTDPDDDDDLVTLQDHANFIREKAELTEQVKHTRARLMELLDRNNRMQEKLVSLLTDLFEIEDSQVNGYLVQHGIKLPTHQYAFTVKVTGTVTRTAWGVTENEASESIDWSYIDSTEVENIHYETRDGVEYTEEIDSTPMDLTEFLKG